MSDNIKVVVKVRPLISREIEDKLSYRWRVKNETQLLQLDANGRENDTCFTFDKVYDKDTKTQEVYNDVAKPIVEAAIAGFNGTIFAYGQTSSGKTYTMTGTEQSPGIIPLAVLNLFEIIKEKKDRDFLVRVSYIEIYNETLRDLLNVEKKNIKIHDTLQGVKVYCSEKVTGSPEEVLEAMKEGEANRQTGATNMNEESSRSHSIFQITVESREHVEDEAEDEGSVNVSQLNLVDLAGSERSGQTGATGLRFKEGTHINKSLSSLALVIKQLSEDPHKYANYRDSKLTRILQNSLGGNAKTSIICAITPASVDETASTLQFANRAKSIKNKPEVNAVATSATMIQSLTKQLSRLQSELAAKRNLEVMLESSKNVEQELQGRIAKLQKMILNGFGHRPGLSMSGHAGRRNLPAPRRVTISTLHNIEEEPAPHVARFCTPGLKYNPLSMAMPPPPPYSKLPAVAEEARAVTPPGGGERADLQDEVIEINSDDDSMTETRCSPYHKCYVSSKTPPCVLRKNAKRAEKNLQDIVELTDREKIYTPSVVELIEKLEQHANVIVELQEEVTVLKEKAQEKDSKIEELKTKVSQTETEVKSVHSSKSDLEERCKEKDVRLTDWEVSYETLVRKSKTREEELLSLLADQQVAKKRESLGKPTKMESEMINFMNMSKDISLVHSDDSSTNDDGSSHMHELVANIQSELATKNKTIIDLEADLYAQKQKIESLENSSQSLQNIIDEFKNQLGNIESENSILKCTIDNLNATIESQKESLDSADKDIQSYNSTIQELQIKLSKKENILIKFNDNVLDTMIANEHKLISNNDNIKNIIHSLKISLDNRNKEIDRLKTIIEENKAVTADNLTLKEQIDVKENQISLLIAEAEKLKDQLNENVIVINKLMKVEQNLSSQLSTIEVEHKTLQEQIVENGIQIESLKKINSESEHKIENLLSENENLARQIAESINNQGLSKQVKDMTQRLDCLERELNEMDKYVKIVTEKNDESQINFTKAKTILSKIQKIALKLKCNTENLSEPIEDLTKVLEIIDTKLTDFDVSATQNLKNISELEDQLSTIATEKDSQISIFKSEVESLNSELAIQTENLTQKIMYLIDELTSTRAELESKDQEIIELEEKLTDALSVKNNGTETKTGEHLVKGNAVLTKLYTIMLRLNREIESDSDTNDNIDELFEKFDDKLDVLDSLVTQTLQMAVDLQKQLLSLANDKESEIANFQAQIEKINSDMAIQTGKLSQQTSHLIEELSKTRNDLSDKNDELVKLESQLKDTLIINESLSKELSDLANDKKSENANYQSQIEKINSEMAIQTQEVSEHTTHLIENLTKAHSDLKNKNREIFELKLKLHNADENIENLRNDLISKDNSITLLHEKLASLYSELEILTTMNMSVDTLERLLKEKYAQVEDLEERITHIGDTLEDKYRDVTNALEDSIQKRDMLLMEILKKAARVARQCGLNHNEIIENNDDDNVYENVVLTLDRIGMSVALLKTENDVERIDIEKMLMLTKEQIEILTKTNLSLMNNNENLRNDNNKLLLEIEHIKNLNIELSNNSDILEHLNLELRSKSNEIDTMESKAMEWKEQFKTYEKCMKEQMNELKVENEKLKNIQKREWQRQSMLSDVAQKSSNLVDNLETNSPQSLLTICCNNIINAIKNRDTEMSVTTSSMTTSSSKFSNLTENIETQTEKCNCDKLFSQLSKVNDENLKLVKDLGETTRENLEILDLLKDLQATNDYLLKERDDVKKEIQMLMEPAIELQKKITNHRTNLSTLTATTYAENKLLNSQLKVLKHHHTRHIYVCQRDLPAVKTQLNELMTLLKESTFIDNQNANIKRFSLPDVLDSSNSASTFKNDSTLDGDLLMLDTNLTLTTVDNTLVGPDQTYLDVTQINFDANETACQTNDISKIIDPCLLYSQIETLSHENQSLGEQIKNLTQENIMLKNEIQTTAMPPTSYKDAQNSPVKMNNRDDDDVIKTAIEKSVCEYCLELKEDLRTLEETLNAEVTALSKELLQIKAEKENIVEKYTNLTLEMPSTETLMRKLSNTEKDNATKIQEINKLTNTLNKKNKVIKELQDENDTLSVQVMDNISEADTLKKELDELKDINIMLFEKCEHLEEVAKKMEIKSNAALSCSQCDKKDDIIKSLQLEHSRLTRSLSDSDSSSRHNKICTLQNELHESKEDCKKITEEVTTIKHHLERSNISVSPAMDLDESIGDSNVFVVSKDLDNTEKQLQNSVASVQTPDLYTSDKIECFNYYINKFGSGKENFDSDVKIIDIMKAFYNKLVAKYGDEVDNLLNKLRDFENSKEQLQKQLNEVTTEYSKATNELHESQNNIKTVTFTLNKIRDNINIISQEMTNVVDTDKNTKFVTIFKDNLLKVFDSEFGLSCVNIFESLIENIVNKHQNDLSKIMEQYTKLQSHMESVVTESNAVNENMKKMKCQLTDRENEYNLMKAQKQRVHEISNAVTLDIIKKEQELTEMLAKGYEKLVDLDVIVPYKPEPTLPLTENLKLLFENIIIRNQNMPHLENENQNQATEINYLKTALKEKEQMLSTLETKLSECQKYLQIQKSLHEDLNKVYENKVKENKTYIETIDKIGKEITALQEEKENMLMEITTLKENVVKTDSELDTEQTSEPTKDYEHLDELLTRLEYWKRDYENLKTVNDMITKEKDTIASDLEKAQDIIAKNKAELDTLTSDVLVLRESVKDNSGIIETLKLEAKSMIEQNLELKKQFEEKSLECSRLEMNIKTHEKTAEIQSKMIMRLQKQKEEDDNLAKQKDEQLKDLSVKLTSLHKEFEKMTEDLKSAKEEVESLKKKKDSLEAKVNELEMDLNQDGHRRRQSMDAIAEASRRRRQSLHDTRRTFGEEQDPARIEEVFGSRNSPDDLFMDVDGEFGRGRDSLPPRQDTDDEPTSRPSSVMQTRRRRQSIHDQYRSVVRHTPSPHDTFTEAHAQNDDNMAGDSGLTDAAHLRERLHSTQQELEDLKEKYRELDEECEICAQYLHERDEQCRKLKKERAALERQVEEMTGKLKFNPNLTELKANFAHAAVNTDEDWANLHSVVVDRMSFDAEVEKNKKLSRTIDELRCNKQELKNTLGKMQKALEKNAAFMHSKELDAAKAELAACKQELAELRERYRELDEECDTCAQYLRERDEQCRKLREAKHALEKKLEELQGDIGSMAAVTRRKRQSAHDQNRSPQPPLAHAHTQVGDDFLSSQVERDDNALKASKAQLQELQRVKMALERVVREKALLEKQLLPPALPPAIPPALYVATGSAIVQNQQLTDVMKENQKLKKINSKLISICKKRGKSHEANRENEEPASDANSANICDSIS